mgnify:CR=1 FL=1|tara:strand:+ start:627 stop:1538 length:912 start_codon:yes stop_codon:yes gene_type:complete
MLVFMKFFLMMSLFSVCHVSASGLASLTDDDLSSSSSSSAGLSQKSPKVQRQQITVRPSPRISQACPILQGDADPYMDSLQGSLIFSSFVVADLTRNHDSICARNLVMSYMKEKHFSQKSPVYKWMNYLVERDFIFDWDRIAFLSSPAEIKSFRLIVHIAAGFLKQQEKIVSRDIETITFREKDAQRSFDERLSKLQKKFQAVRGETDDETFLDSRDPASRKFELDRIKGQYEDLSRQRKEVLEKFNQYYKEYEALRSKIQKRQRLIDKGWNEVCSRSSVQKSIPPVRSGRSYRDRRVPRLQR